MQCWLGRLGLLGLTVALPVGLSFMNLACVDEGIAAAVLVDTNPSRPSGVTGTADFDLAGVDPSFSYSVEIQGLAFGLEEIIRLQIHLGEPHEVGQLQADIGYGSGIEEQARGVVTEARPLRRLDVVKIVDPAVVVMVGLIEAMTLKLKGEEAG